MASRKRRTRRWSAVIGSVIGLILVFTFVLSLLNLDVNTGGSSEPVEFPTFTPFGQPAPTLTPSPVVFPTPQPDLDLAGRLPYIHSSGLFRVFYPVGDDWFTEERNDDAPTDFQRVAVRSVERLAVILNFIQPGIEFETLESLSTNYLDAAYHANQWTLYDSWQERDRQITDDAVVIDFDLTLNDNAYLGREIDRLDGSTLLVVRLVVPANNPQLLDELQQYAVPGLVRHTPLQALPETWPAQIDQQLGYVFKHPSIWQRVAGGTGRPVTLHAPDDILSGTLRLLTEPGRVVDSPEAAAAWVTEREPSAEVVGEVQPVETPHAAGYQVAYAFRNPAGDPQSGLVTLLTDAHGVLFSADLQVALPDLDLLAGDDLPGPAAEAAQAVTSGLYVLPDAARVPVAEVFATPEPDADAGADADDSAADGTADDDTADDD